MKRRRRVKRCHGMSQVIMFYFWTLPLPVIYHPTSVRFDSIVYNMKGKRREVGNCFDSHQKIIQQKCRNPKRESEKRPHCNVLMQLIDRKIQRQGLSWKCSLGFDLCKKFVFFSIESIKPFSYFFLFFRNRFDWKSFYKDFHFDLLKS